MCHLQPKVRNPCRYEDIYPHADASPAILGDFAGRVALRQTFREVLPVRTPDFAPWRPRSKGTLYTGPLDAGGFVHWRPRSRGTLHTGAGRHCTNPLRNDTPSAQSPDRCFRTPHFAIGPYCFVTLGAEPSVTKWEATSVTKSELPCPGKGAMGRASEKARRWRGSFPSSRAHTPSGTLPPACRVGRAPGLATISYHGGRMDGPPTGAIPIFISCMVTIYFSQLPYKI